jgi:hypothetical protein
MLGHLLCGFGWNHLHRAVDRGPLTDQEFSSRSCGQPDLFGINIPINLLLQAVFFRVWFLDQQCHDPLGICEMLILALNTDPCIRNSGWGASQSALWPLMLSWLSRLPMDIVQTISWGKFLICSSFLHLLAVAFVWRRISFKLKSLLILNYSLYGKGRISAWFIPLIIFLFLWRCNLHTIKCTNLKLYCLMNFTYECAWASIIQTKT